MRLLPLLLLLLLLPSAFGLSLSGKRLGPITYIPNTIMTNHYTASDTTYPINVTVDGGIFTNISITEVIDNSFDLIISFPTHQFVPAGSYTFGLTVREIPPDSGSSIATQVAVSKIFTVNVYSYEKEIQASLDIPNVNQGRNATVHLNVQSLGYPDIQAVQSIVTLYNLSGSVLSTAATETKPLKSLGGITFTPSLRTDRLPAAPYAVKAQIFYDQKQKDVNTTFQIGNIDIELKNYTRELTPGYSDFSLTILNKWGNPLKNVYALLFIDNQELLHTPSTDIPAWEAVDLKGIVRVDLLPGAYPALLKIFYEEEVKEIPITLKVREIPTEVQQEVQQAKISEFIPSFIIIGILVIILWMYAIYHWRHRDEI